MNKFKCFEIIIWAGLLVTAGFVSIQAEDLVTNLRLQYWTYGVDGRASVHGSALDISDSDKMLAGQNNGFVLAGERLFDEWGLSMDAFFGKQSGVQTISSAENVDWNMEVAYLTMGAFRRFIDKEFEGNERKLSLDGTAGVRPFLNYYKLQFNPYNPSNDKSRSDYVSWVDTFLGLRLKAALNSRWDFELYGDMGGFGIGNGSQLSVLIRTDLVWNVTPTFNIIGGYRFFDFDTEHQSGDQQTKIDLQMSGPTLGIQGRF